MNVTKMSVFPAGGVNKAFARYFVGQSYLNTLSADQAVNGNVAFEPACRDNRRTHYTESGGGQMPLEAAGEGWYQSGINRPKGR